MEWQPIETAPRDGGRIIGCSFFGETYIVNIFTPCYYGGDNEFEGWHAENDHDYEVVEPGFWMPLPAPPSAA